MTETGNDFGHNVSVVTKVTLIPDLLLGLFDSAHV